MHNAILALRQQELAQSTKPFNARGGKVKRCDGCLLPIPDCLCTEIPAPVAESVFVFLMYKGECFKPSNTGRLVADVAKTHYAFTWHRTDPHVELITLLADPDYSPMIIFPHEYAQPHRCVQDVISTKMNLKPLFIMLDGTWREARKMFRKSDYLQHIPVLGISPVEQSNYKLREAAHDYQLCTAEVGVEVLKLAGEGHAAAILSDYFSRFRQQYVKGKPHKHVP